MGDLAQNIEEIDTVIIFRIKMVKVGDGHEKMILKFSFYIPAKSWLKKSTKGQMSPPRIDTPVT